MQVLNEAKVAVKRNLTTEKFIDGGMLALYGAVALAGIAIVARKAGLTKAAKVFS